MKALFCGLGSIGQRHLRNLLTLEGSRAEVLAYRARGGGPVLNPDMSVRPGVTLEEAYRLRSFKSLDEALAAGPAAVFITNPNTLHLPVALRAAHAGCHLFIEKPLSHSPEGVRELMELVERKKLTLFVAYQFRFHPGLRRVKALIDEGRLGQLASAHIVNGEYLPDWHPYEDYRETHPARRELGGGCLRIQTHELDMLLWLFGMPRRLFASGGQLSRLEVDVEDSVSMLAECVHQGRPVAVHVHLDYLQRPPQRVCEVVGDAGRLRYDYYGNQVEFHDLKTRVVERFCFDRFERNQMFLDEMAHFLACVRGGDRPIVDGAEALRSMRIAEAAEKSMTTHQAVELD